MMKKKNVAVAMAAVTMAGTIAPAIASANTVVETTQNNITVNEYATLEAKLNDMLSKTYSTDSNDLITSGSTVTTGGSVYTITMNTTGQTTTTINSPAALKAVSDKINKSKLGTVFNFTIVDNGHTVKSDGTITNIGVNTYTISDLVKFADDYKAGKIEVASGYTLNPKFDNTKSELVIEVSNSKKVVECTLTLKAGDKKLNFTKKIEEGTTNNKKVVGFQHLEEALKPVTHNVSVANAIQEEVTVSEEEITTIAEELISKYDFDSAELANAKSKIELVNGKYQVILFAKDIKLTKAVRSVQTTDGTVAQIVLTANTKEELEALIDALAGTTDFTQIIGEERIDTAIALSKANYNNDGKSPTGAVVLVGQTAIVDGLAAAPLAAKNNAPILLTETNSLTEEVKAEIKRVMGLGNTITQNRIKTVYIAGGEAVVSAEVEKELISMGVTVKRLAGETRFETSLKIAEEVGIGTNKKVYAVGGYGLADAMSIAPVAANTKDPIVVVDGVNGLSTDAKSFLRGCSNADVIGGTEVVNATVLSEIATATGNATRVAGEDRQETNAKVINKYFANGSTDVYVSKDGYAKEDQLVDALAAAPIAGNANAPIVLATNSLTTDQAIAVSKLGSTKLTQVGGGVAESVINNLKKLLGL